MAYAASILADSITEEGNRLTTMEITLPRMVLAELNTHRALSRNSASSRAIPVEKQLAKILQDPFVPEYWGVNQSGMQAEAELLGEDQDSAITVWLEARDKAVEQVQQLLQKNVHKQLANRLLEPFMWHTVILTATQWSNFYALRANAMAQPEIRTIAEMMLAIYEDSTPSVIGLGGWHLPLIQDEERDGVFELTEDARKISAARCARVSYLTHSGKRDLSADLELYDRLARGGHLSPLEHVATPIASHQRFWKRIGEPVSIDLSSAEDELDERDMWSGNFYGWKQLRKFIPNEHDFGLVGKDN